MFQSLNPRKRRFPAETIDLNEDRVQLPPPSETPPLESAQDRIKRLKEALKKQAEALERVKQEREESRKLLEEMEDED